MHKRARRRSFLILALFIVLGSLSSLTVTAEDPQYNLGLLPSNYDGPLYDMSGMGLLALPTSVDLSDGLPPIGDQRYQNSCVGWAVAYYYKTYQEAQERGWSLTDTSHRFSPSYVYNQRSTSDCGNDGGMTMWNGLNIIKQQGVAPLSSMPYTCRSGVPCEACTQPSQAQIDAAYPYRSDSFSALFSYQGGADINGLKTLLASGQPFLIAIPVYTSFYQVSYANPVVPVPAANESLAGGHAMFVVGYDDAKGGFLTANSWGSGWGWNGYCYLSYDFVQQKAWEGWIMTDHVESGVTPTPTATRTQTPQNTPEGPTATPTMTPTRSWPTATPVGPTATPVTPPSIDITLTTGWNLIGIPFEPCSSQIDDLFGPIIAKVESVLGWDATLQGWQRYTPGTPLYANSLSNVGAGQALWVKVASSDVLPLYSSINLGSSQVVSLQPGWNMVSFCGESAMDVGDAMATIEGNYSVVVAFESEPLQRWLRYDPEAEPQNNTLSVMEPGKGYWIEATGACQWTLP